MDRLFGEDLFARLGRLERGLHDVGDAVLDPWVLIQLAVVIVAFALSIPAGRRLERALEPRVRAIQGQPRLLRLSALLLRRTRWIVAGLALAVAVAVLREVTLPSHGAIVAIAAVLVAAWVVISVVSRLIRDRTLSRLVAWVAWVIVALRVTGLFDRVSSGLDSLALRIGTARISAYDVIEAAIVLSAVIWVAIFAGQFLERRIAASADLTPSLKVLIGKAVRIALIVLAGAVALAALGIDLTALTVFSGAVGVGLGFGLQKVVSNFVSGIIILLDKSIKPGDTIELGETFGWVRSLRSRFVSVMTRDGTEYLVPNEDFITQRVVSWSHTATAHRLDVEFGVAPTSDPHEVRRIAVAAAAKLDRIESRPQPVCHMTRFDGSEIGFILRFWIADPQNGVTNIRGAVLLACWDAFAAAGVALSLPTRNIVLHDPVRVHLKREE